MNWILYGNGYWYIYYENEIIMMNLFKVNSNLKMIISI